MRVLVVVAAMALVGLSLTVVNTIAPRTAGASATFSYSVLPTTGLSPASSNAQVTTPIALSCPSATMCVSTGQYQDLSSNMEGFVGVGTTSAGNWTLSTLPVTGLSPLSNVAIDVNPLSVSCPSATTCVVVGQYLDVSSNYDGFIGVGTFTSGNWSWALSTLSTTGLSPAAALASAVAPNSVSCPSPSSCVVAGQYDDVSNETYGFFATGTLSAGTWTWATAPLPIVGLNPIPYVGSGLSAAAISCPSTTNCVVTGNYSPDSVAYLGFIAVGTLISGNWSWTVSALPTTTLSPEPYTPANVNPLSISCPSTTTCVAVGQYMNANSTYSGLVVAGSLNAGSWSWSMSALSDNNFISALASSSVAINSVQCLSITSCVATGEYVDSGSGSDAFVSQGTLVAGTWEWINSVMLAGSSLPGNTPSPTFGSYDVACPTTNDCVATGNYRDALNAYRGFVASFALAPAASTPIIIDIPASATVGGSFINAVLTNGDGPIITVSNTPSVCTVKSVTVSFVGVGTCSLTVSVHGGEFFSGATGNPQTFAVGAAVTTTTTAITTTTVAAQIMQSPLFISNSRDGVPVRARVALTTRGGSGSGLVSFHTASGGCVIRSDLLRVNSIRACVVVAAKAGDVSYKPQRSASVTFYFGFKAQKALVLKVSSRSVRHSARVSLFVAGGSGHGVVRYTVKGAHCSITGQSLRASRATSCIVVATKGSSGTFLPVSSRPVVVVVS